MCVKAATCFNSQREMVVRSLLRIVPVHYIGTELENLCGHRWIARSAPWLADWGGSWSERWSSFNAEYARWWPELRGWPRSWSAARCPPPPKSLNEALSSAYRYNPRLDAERARLRATDEEVARAMSGYRPIITGNADINHQHTNTRPDSIGEGSTKPKGYSVDLVQPIFSGLQTVNAVSEQEANVRAGRETLRDVEQQVLLDAVTAYMDVVRDQAIVKLRENNVNVLSRELKATRGSLRRRRGDAHRRRAGAGPPRRRRVAARSRARQSEDQPRDLRARRRPSARATSPSRAVSRSWSRTRCRRRSSSARRAIRP